MYWSKCSITFWNHVWEVTLTSKESVFQPETQKSSRVWLKREVDRTSRGWSLTVGKRWADPQASFVTGAGVASPGLSQR